MEFIDEDHQRNYFDKKKQRIVESEKTIKNALSSRDRKLLKTFFGYDGLKNKSDAPLYVRDSLWPENETTAVKQDVNEEEIESVSRIFPRSKENWKVGSKLTPIEEIAVLRAYQTFSRVYSTDLALKRLKYGVKILLAGPVSVYGYFRSFPVISGHFRHFRK